MSVEQRKKLIDQGCEIQVSEVLRAIETRSDGVQATVLRGISDFGDERKKKLDRIGNGGLRSYATRNTLRLLWGLIEGVFPRA